MTRQLISVFTRPLRVVILILSVFLSASVFANELHFWPPELAKSLTALQAHPQQIIDDEKQRNLDALSNEQKSIHYLVLSRAYAALMLHEQSTDNAEQGLALLNNKQPAWLYNALLVSKAEALDTAGHADEGLKIITPVIEWARQAQMYDLLATSLATAGYIHLSLSAGDEAISAFQQGYVLAQQQPTRLKTADFAAMMSLVYDSRQEPELAKPYLEEAVAYYRSNDMTLDLANALYNLSRIYMAAGNEEKGLPMLRESANLALEIHDLQGAAYSYKSLADYLIKQNKTDQAEPFLEDALKIFESASNPYMQISVLVALSNIRQQKAEYQQALDVLDQGLALADGEAFLSSQLVLNNRKAEVFAAMGNYEQAYKLMLTIQNMQANLTSERNTQRLLELKTQFDVEQQQAQNALLREQNLRQQSQLQSEQNMQRFMIAMAFLLVVICLLLLWLYMNGKRHRLRFELLANEDELTGVLSRRKAMDNVEQQLQLAKRHNTPMTIALLDLDHFKQINDKFGHQIGDDVLRAFGKLAVKTFRSTDILGRIGGEEFLFAFPHTTLEQAQTLLDRFSSVVRTIPDTINQAQLNVTVSIGLVSRDISDASGELIGFADEALYNAKVNGRNRTVIYHHALASSAS